MKYKSRKIMVFDPAVQQLGQEKKKVSLGL